MVSRSRAKSKSPERIFCSWEFQFKNRNLRAIEASRNSTASEHSISAGIRVFARAVDEMAERAGIRDNDAPFPSEKSFHRDKTSMPGQVPVERMEVDYV
jgi:hypothetical protein